jgi:hypothetical protein
MLAGWIVLVIMNWRRSFAAPVSWINASLDLVLDHNLDQSLQNKPNSRHDQWALRREERTFFA